MAKSSYAPKRATKPIEFSHGFRSKVRKFWEQVREFEPAIKVVHGPDKLIPYDSIRDPDGQDIPALTMKVTIRNHEYAYICTEVDGKIAVSPEKTHRLLDHSALDVVNEIVLQHVMDRYIEDGEPTLANVGDDEHAPFLQILNYELVELVQGKEEKAITLLMEKVGSEYVLSAHGPSPLVMSSFKFKLDSPPDILAGILKHGVESEVWVKQRDFSLEALCKHFQTQGLKAYVFVPDAADTSMLVMELGPETEDAIRITNEYPSRDFRLDTTLHVTSGSPKYAKFMDVLNYMLGMTFDQVIENNRTRPIKVKPIQPMVADVELG